MTGAAAAVVTFSSLAYFQTSVVRRDGTLAIYFGTEDGEVVGPSAIQAAPREFMLLLLQGNDAAGESDLHEENDRVAQYRAWAGGIASDGYPVQGQKLTQLRYRLIRGDEGEVTTLADATGTGDDTAELVTGYFRIGARSLDEALTIAQTCPHLMHGGRIEVREVDPRTRR